MAQRDGLLIRRGRLARQPCALWRVREDEKPNQTTQGKAEGSEKCKVESPAHMYEPRREVWETQPARKETYEMPAVVERYRQTHEPSEERRSACSPRLPPNDEYSRPDDRGDQDKPAISPHEEPTACERAHPEPRTYGADRHQQRAQQPPEQKPPSFVGGSSEERLRTRCS